ncbi:MAG: hypothetical protein Q9209_007204 [Squamulea sp. 1 TL-2023]
MSRNDTYLSLCLEQASLSSLHYRHGCIVVRGGKVIGMGHNDYRSGFNGGTQATGQLGVCSPKSKHPKHSRHEISPTRKKSSNSYVAFDSRDHAVGTGGGSLANSPLSMHSEMMAINSALSLSSAISCQGTARSTQWLQKPCFKLSSRSKRRSRLQHLKAYSDAVYQAAQEQAAALERRGGSYVQPSRFEASASQQRAARAGGLLQRGGGGGRAVGEEEEERNSYVHHHIQINYLEFQKAKAQKALQQPTSDNNEKNRKQYLYGKDRYRHHSHHEKQQTSTPPQQQQQLRSSAIVVPQSRIVPKSHQVAERMKDSRLNGADLYVARLGKTGKVNHYDCGCQHANSTAVEDREQLSSASATSTGHEAKPLTGSLHEELRFPSPNEEKKPPPMSVPKGEQLTATYSRPCYRCISYMHSAGIKRVFWTNNKGEWESGKVRELVDALEGPVSPNSDGSTMSVGDVYVTKSEVLLLKGLK